MRRIPVWILLALAGTPGCYLFNGLGGGGASDLDASVRGTDAATPTPSHDATPLDVQRPEPLDAPRIVDVWYADTGPPLPAEPEPDPGPDGRPSDDPGDDWVDPPDPDDAEPCCTLSEPVRLAARPAAAFDSGPPLVGWRPGRWVIAATRRVSRGEILEHRLVVFELDDVGRPTGDARELEAPPMEDVANIPSVRALRWAGGRWAFVAEGDSTRGSEREVHVRLFDAAWAPASTWLDLGPGMGANVAYLARGNGWVAFTSYPDVLRTTAFDELGGVGAWTESPAPWSSTLGAASFRSRAAVVPISAESSPDFVVVDPEGSEVGRVARTGRWIPAGGMAAVRDLAVLAVRNEGRIEVEVFDPFASRRVAGPRTLAELGVGDDGAITDSVDVAGSSKFGVAGVCWGVPAAGGRGGGADSQIRFGLVGEDALPRGAAVTIVSSRFRGDLVSCTVGTDDRGFLVAWWNGSELWVRRVDLAPSP
ncbi:MAG: hypothetical protein J0L92_18610 [Deltaproteobacteria bacterium]|nr:hypothetical protein [Deltaproteobacteria bacterium]